MAGGELKLSKKKRKRSHQPDEGESTKPSKSNRAVPSPSPLLDTAGTMAPNSTSTPGKGQTSNEQEPDPSDLQSILDSILADPHWASPTPPLIKSEFEDADSRLLATNQAELPMVLPSPIAPAVAAGAIPPVSPTPRTQGYIRWTGRISDVHDRNSGLLESPSPGGISDVHDRNSRLESPSSQSSFETNPDPRL
jgi:hypothetical protein